MNVPKLRYELPKELLRSGRFNLQLYLSITSGAMIIILGVLLWIGFSRLMTYNIGQFGQQYTTVIARGISARIFNERSAVNSLGTDWDLSNPVARDQLEHAIQEGMQMYQVDNIKLFNREGCVIYSTVKEEIGQCEDGNELLQTALSGTLVATFQSTNDLRLQIGGIGLDVLESYIPVGIQAKKEQPLYPGVFEIHLDLAPFKQSILKSNADIVSILILALSTFLIFQIYFARRADALISAQQQALETHNQELETLQERKDDLTKMIVHDMKSPLTGVLGYLDLLQNLSEPLMPQQERIVERAHQASQRLMDMVMNLLTISRLEEGELTLKREPVDLKELVNEVLNAFDLAIREGNKKISTEIAENVPPVSAEREIIYRILSNLLSNAIKHTEQGGEIVIDIETLEDAVKISVSDDGEGIPQEAFPRLFQKFSSIPNRKLGSYTDTGLGLAFCRLAVEMHGGQIWAESKLSVGSTFTFTLPLEK